MGSILKKDPKCSFCGKTNKEVLRMIAGNGCLICDECIALCNDIISKESKAGIGGSSGDMKIPKPSEIKKILDLYIIGQEKAKEVVSVAVYNHYKRIGFVKPKCEMGELSGVEIVKSNILLVGPTGSGKTLVAQTIAKMVDVPFAIADATTLTQAGYVGEDVENVLVRLLQSADYDVSRAEKGIIYIDEIDKLSRKSESQSITRDVSGEGVQQALLKLIEGTVASVPPQGGRKHPNQEMINIKTNDILFICGGAFDGLDKILERRKNKSLIGFTPKSKSKSKDELKTKIEDVEEITSDDLIKYGLIPEMVGRLPVIGSLSKITKEDMVKILSEPKNSIIQQFKKLLLIDGIQVDFQDKTLEKIADIAIQLNTGARGLKRIMENVMSRIMFDMPDHDNVEKIIVTPQTVEDYSKFLKVEKSSKKNDESSMKIKPKIKISTKSKAKSLSSKDKEKKAI